MWRTCLYTKPLPWTCKVDTQQPKVWFNHDAHKDESRMKGHVVQLLVQEATALDLQEGIKIIA
jgi:hypothetical protein